MVTSWTTGSATCPYGRCPGHRSSPRVLLFPVRIQGRPDPRLLHAAEPSRRHWPGRWPTSDPAPDWRPDHGHLGLGAAPRHRPLAILWLESYARSLAEPDGPWAGFAEQTVADWLTILANAQRRPAVERRRARAADRGTVRVARAPARSTGHRRRRSHHRPVRVALVSSAAHHGGGFVVNVKVALPSWYVVRQTFVRGEVREHDTLPDGAAPGLPWCVEMHRHRVVPRPFRSRSRLQLFSASTPLPSHGLGSTSSTWPAAAGPSRCTQEQLGRRGLFRAWCRARRRSWPARTWPQRAAAPWSAPWSVVAR